MPGVPAAHRCRSFTLAAFLACFTLLGGAFAAFDVATADASQSPVAAYSFDANEGSTLEDVSENEHEGAIEGATWTDRGKYGSALAFAGEGEDCVTVPESKDLELTEELTLEAWVRPSGAIEDDPIIFKESLGIGGVPAYAMGLGVTDEGNPEGIIGDEAVTENVEAPSAIESGVWTHLAFTYDGAKMRLYVNGALVATQKEERSPPEAPGTLKIGCAAPWWEEGFDGRIDEVRIYDRALSAGEIAADAGTPLETPPSGPVADYAFDEGTGETVEDLSGHEHTATIEGAEWARGRYGGGLEFKEEEACVSIPNDSALNFTEELTLEAWVRPEGSGSEGLPVLVQEDASAKSGEELYVYDLLAGQKEVPKAWIRKAGSGYGGVYGKAALPEHAWAHLALTDDGVKMRLYVNGELVGTAEAPHLTTGTGNLKIGCDPFGGSFKGRIDEVRIYDRALGAGEVAADAGAPLQTPPSGPVAAYSFDEGEGTSVADLTGDGHTATIEGAEWTTQGRYGGAMEFSGGEECLSVKPAEDLQFSEKFTLEAWVRPVGSAEEALPVLTQKDPGASEAEELYAYELLAGQNEVPKAWVRKPGSGYQGVYGTEHLPERVWSHLAVTVDGAHLRLYVNGELVRTTVAPQLTTGSGDLAIGCDAFGGFFKGRIDEVRIYNRALSQAELQVDGAAALITPSDGPVAAYSYDKGAGGTVEDISGHEHIGVREGPNWTARGRFGSALDFEGKAEECVSVADSEDLALSEEMTLETWVKPSGATEDDPIIFKEGYGVIGYAMGLGFSSEGKPDGTIGEGEGESTSVSAPEAVESNVWTHLAFTYDGAHMRLYVNGELVATKAQAMGPVAVGGKLAIGCNPLYPETFTGRIDETRIYDRALSAAEIMADSSAPVQTPPRSPVAAYAFDEGSGETLDDITGNGHDGAIEGATWTDSGKYGSALSFAGEGEDCVTVLESEQLQLTEELTLEAWVKPSGPTEDDPIIFKESLGIGGVPSYAMGIGVTNAGKPEGIIGDEAETENVEAPSAIESNVWTHLAFTYDGAKMRLYVNGALVATQKEERSPPEAPGTLKIGCSAPWWEEGFDGRIDEVRIYDRALNAGEVANSLNALPAVAEGETYGVEDTEAVVSGTIDPMGEEMAVFYEYGQTKSYGDIYPTSPAEVEDLIDGNGPQEVEELLENLQPETTYHYRLVASNSGNRVVGPDQQFTTTALLIRKPSEYTGLIGVGWSGSARTYSSEPYMEDVPNSHAKIFRVVVNPGFDNEAHPHQVKEQRELNDKLFGFMAKEGIKILLDVSGIPGYEIGNKLPPIGPGTTARSRWRSGLQLLVNRYGPEGSFWKESGITDAYAPVFWEVWNEENEEKNADYQFPGEKAKHGKTGEIDPARYGVLLEISHQVIEEANNGNSKSAPQMKVMFGGLLTGKRNVRKPAKSPNQGPSHYSVGRFIRATGHSEDYDALSLHPYAFHGSVSAIASKVKGNVKKARIALNQRGGEGKKIWVTEIGWPVDEGGVEHDGVHTPVSPATQKARLEPTFDMLKEFSGTGAKELNIGNIIWYNIRDAISDNPFPREWAAHCGLFTEKGSARGVLEAFRNEAK